MLFRTSIALAALVACNPDGTTPSNDDTRTIDGSVPNHETARTPATLLGTATRVQATSAMGDPSIVASDTLNANGDYQLAVPTDIVTYRVEAVSADGNVVGAVLVDARTGTSVLQAAPMTAESTLEADVLLQMADDGLTRREVDLPDMTKRVSADLAAAYWSEAIDQDVALRALAEATVAAQETRLEVVEDADLDLRLADLENVKLRDWLTGQKELDAGDSAADVSARFRVNALDAEGTLGIDPTMASFAEHQASIAFREVLKARTSGSIPETGAVASAQLEAQATTRHMDWLAQTEGFGSSIRADIQSANSVMLDDLAEATSGAQVQTVFDDYANILISGEEGVLARAATPAGPAFDLDLVLTLAREATSALEADVADVNATVQAEVIAEDIRDAWLAFRSDVDAAAAANTSPSDQDAAFHLIAEAQGSFVTP